MANIAKRLHGPAQVSNVAATKYTVPAVTKTVIRHVHISNPSGSPVTFTMSVGADAAAVRVFDAFSVPANSVYDWWTYLVIEAAEVIQALAGTTLVLTLTIDGDEKILG